MNRIYLRIIAAMLASLMLLFAVACSEPKAPVETTDEVSDESTSEEETTTEEVTTEMTTTQAVVTTQTSHDVPKDLDVDKEITVLHWSDSVKPEFERNEPSINGVENAIYKRNLKTVDYLGLTKLSWVGIAGNQDRTEAFTEHVGNSYVSGDRAYDLVAAHSLTAVRCMLEGYLADLASIEGSYIDLEKPWWPGGFADTVTIDGSLYLLTGDISTNTIYGMKAVFYNYDLWKELKPEDPYSLVVDKKWTIEALMRISESVAGKQADGTERFGFVAEGSDLDALCLGAGIRLVERDPDDALSISEDITSKKLENLIGELAAFCSSSVVSTVESDMQFLDRNALFILADMNKGSRKLSRGDRNVALPLPMYDEKQNGYRTPVWDSMTLWGIMGDVESKSWENATLTECTAVIELLAYFGYVETTPQIAHSSLSYCYCGHPANTQNDACFEILREGIVLDLGNVLLGSASGNSLRASVASLIRRETTEEDFSVALAMYRANLKATVAKIRENAD